MWLSLKTIQKLCRIQYIAAPLLTEETKWLLFCQYCKSFIGCKSVLGHNSVCWFTLNDLGLGYLKDHLHPCDPTLLSRSGLWGYLMAPIFSSDIGELQEVGPSLSGHFIYEILSPNLSTVTSWSDSQKHILPHNLTLHMPDTTVFSPGLVLHIC